MNLKESFRLQTVFDNFLMGAQNFLAMTQFCNVVTEVHHTEAAGGPADKTVCNEVQRVPDVPVDVMIAFCVVLLTEKANLCTAISKAKAGCGVDIDGSVIMNKQMQRISRTLIRLGNEKPHKQKTSSSSYRINAAGDQSRYVYEVEQDITPAYNTAQARSIGKELIKRADDVSRDLDKLMISTAVDYTPPFDINDTFEDAALVYAQKYAQEHPVPAPATENEPS